MFTVEIGGKPIAVTDADEPAARGLFEGQHFRHDMQRWLSDGKPIWDGRAPFNVRPASRDEEARFKGPDPYPPHGSEDDDGPTVMMLVEAYDPDDIEED
jgi:hypothetical protein